MAVLERDYLAKVAVPDKLARCQNLLLRAAADAVTRAELAATYLAMGRREEAIREAEHALRDEPKLPRAYSIIGPAYAGKNDLPQARAAFESLVALSPEDSAAHNNLGFLLYAEGRLDEAIAHLEKALSLNPDDALARQNLEKARAAKK